MIRSPILKVLSSMRKRRVKHLLMGGQACVLYGAAELRTAALLIETARKLPEECRQSTKSR